MNLLTFIAAVSSLILVLYVCFSSLPRVFALSCGGSQVAVAHQCECYSPNTNTYGVVCGSTCLEMDCDRTDGQANITVLK